MEHRLCAGLAEGFKVGIEADGSQRRDHEELADGLERRGEICRNEAEARKAGHGQEAQNEPREDGLHVDLHARALALCLLAFKPQADGGKDEDGRDDSKSSCELDHGRKIARGLAESVAGSHNARGVIDRRARPEAESRVGKSELPTENREDDDHYHIKEERRR